MSLKRFLIAVAVLASGFFAGGVAASAQPLYDRILVDFPQPVLVADTTLQPGHYVIRQVDDAASNIRVLMIFSDHGLQLAVPSLTIAAEDPNTPARTSVVLQRYGNNFYLDKIWLQGKNYGYEFLIPPAMKSTANQETAAPSALAATYAPTPVARETAAITPAAPSPSTAPSQPPLAPRNPLPEPSAPAAQRTAPAPVVAQASGNWLALMLSGTMLFAAGLLLGRLRVS